MSVRGITNLQENLWRAGRYTGPRQGDLDAPTVQALADALAAPAFAPSDTGEALLAAIPGFWFDTPYRVAMLFAMIKAETRFRLIEEDLNYSANGLTKTWPSRFGAGRLDPVDYALNPEAIANVVYADRMGNGDVASGDGWTFRGRGWAQLTGRANYEAMSVQTGVDLVASPDLANGADASARIVVAFAQTKPGFLSYADQGNVTACRKAWNGGTNGLQTAVDSFDQVCVLWGLSR